MKNRHCFILLLTIFIIRVALSNLIAPRENLSITTSVIGAAAKSALILFKQISQRTCGTPRVCNYKECFSFNCAYGHVRNENQNRTNDLGASITIIKTRALSRNFSGWCFCHLRPFTTMTFRFSRPNWVSLNYQIMCFWSCVWIKRGNWLESSRPRSGPAKQQDNGRAHRVWALNEWGTKRKWPFTLLALIIERGAARRLQAQQQPVSAGDLYLHLCECPGNFGQSE